MDRVAYSKWIELCFLYTQQKYANSFILGKEKSHWKYSSISVEFTTST